VQRTALRAALCAVALLFSQLGTACARPPASPPAEMESGWIDKYLTPQQREQMRELARQSYAPEALSKLVERGWTEADHQQHLQRYGAFRESLARLVAAGADPAGPEAQAVAGQLAAMIERRSGGDPAIVAGMRKTWEGYNALPAAERPPQYAVSEAEREFLKQAMTVWHRHKPPDRQ